MPFEEEALGVVALSVVVTDSVEGVVEASSCFMVDVEVDLLLNPLVKGARCVSFNSILLLASLRL